METAIPMAEPGFISAGFTRKLVQAWVNSCNDFLQWQRRELIEQKPSPEKLAEHRNTLKLMLRMGRSFNAQVSDPIFRRGSSLRKWPASCASLRSRGK